MELRKRNSPLSLKALNATPEQEQLLIKAVTSLNDQLQQIEKAVTENEKRYIVRVLHKLQSTRRMLNSSVLYALAIAYYSDEKVRQEYIKMLPAGEQDEPLLLVKPHAVKAPSIEVDAYMYLLLLVKLIDAQNLMRAEAIADTLLEKTDNYTHHTLDPIRGKVYFYYALVAELNNKLKTIRPTLLARMRTATLRKDNESVAVLLNCLLRNYLHYSLYDQADMLIKKTKMHDSISNNEWARFYYYLARIEAVKLEYTAAQKSLAIALRKAPHNTPLGFLQACQKLVVVVELLLGNIPERQLFSSPCLRTSLTPYLHLTRVVRLGNVKGFGEVVERYADRFQKDCTNTLISRIRHNVIKTALRSLALAYSCIHLDNVAKTLFLDSAEEAEYVVAKAIKDGVIEARLDADCKCMCTKEPTDVYSTSEPVHAFNERITFCLGVNNQSIRAMRYLNKNNFENEAMAKEKRDLAQKEEELSRELEDDDDDLD